MPALQTVLAPFTMKGFYLLAWGTTLGTNVWNTMTELTFQSGYRTFKTLPRSTFGTLQSRLTPLYFSFSTLSSAALLLTHLYFHPALISSSSPFGPLNWRSSEEGRQGLLILGAFVPQAVNWFYAGPKSTEKMFERHRLERMEGKEATESNPSEAMQKLNKQFGALHGLVSSLNTVSFFSLVGLGLAVSM